MVEGSNAQLVETSGSSRTPCADAGNQEKNETGSRSALREKGTEPGPTT